MEQPALLGQSGDVGQVLVVELEEHPIHCPYCGEPITALVDPSAEAGDYIEDCEVCCQPIVHRLSVAMDGELSLTVQREDE